jgi:hypothetical protein
MSILKRPASIMLTSAALIAALVAAAAPASAAAKTWTIKHGGTVSATAKSFILTDTTTGGSLPCTSSAVKGKLKSGKGLSGTDAGTLTSASVSDCRAEGVGITLKAAHLPWHLNLVSYNSAKGVTTATVTGIHITVAVPALGCTAVVDGTSGSADNGTLQVTYTNKTAKLTTLKTGGKLRIYDVHDCHGLISNGNSVAITASYTVTPAQTITSP